VPTYQVPCELLGGRIRKPIVRILVVDKQTVLDQDEEPLVQAPDPNGWLRLAHETWSQPTPPAFCGQPMRLARY
jgi:hypothetical protein